VRAVVFAAPGRVEVAEVPDPRVGKPDDAVVRVTRSAICGSDLHFYRGEPPLEPGDALGHEAVGVVEAVGGAVSDVEPGDRVAVAFHAACGACWWCARGETGLCERYRNFGTGVYGDGLGGAQAELLLVPGADLNLLRIPDAVDDDRAIFVTDVLTTAVHAASIVAPAPGETVAVLGCGPVGLLLCAALADGAGKVLALDTVADRLALAAGFGAIPVDAASRNPESAVAELTEGRGADVVVDAVGTPAAFERATELVRRGGRVVVVGMYTGEAVEIQLGSLWIRGIDIRFAGVCPLHATWGEAMRAVESGRLDPAPLVTDRLPLERAPEGYERFARREAIKVLLEPAGASGAGSAPA
jgi:2-desacetyl-2-hydroxyethyl bacteriochlorophyllide A dehydrogenase